MEVQPLTAQIEVVIDKQPLIDKINQLEQTIATLTAQKEQLEQDLAAANVQIIALNAQIESLSAQITQLENEKLQLQNQITQLQNEVATLENQKTALENQVASLTNQITSLQEQITQLQSQVSTLESQKADLESQVASLTSQVSSLESQITTLQGQISILQGQITNLQTQVANYESGLDTLNGEVVQNKLDYALESKNLIAAAINEKGGTITSETTLRQYPNQIATLLPNKDIYTTLLMHFDDADNIRKDDSFYSAYNVIMNTGTLELSTSIKKFGNSSYHFNGSNNIFIQHGHGFPFLNGDTFTIEFWYYRTSAFTSTYESIMSYSQSFNSSGTPTSFAIQINNNGIKVQNGSDWSLTSSISSLTLNTWHHIAFSRRDSYFRIFIDGVQTASYTISYTSSSYSIKWGYADFAIGSRYWNGVNFLQGYMDELRVSSQARYTANFTPPTKPFTP